MKNKLVEDNFEHDFYENPYSAAKQMKDFFKIDLSQELNKNSSEVEAFVTKNPELLQQYYDLRHYSYRQENGWKGYDGLESEFDKNGQILIALKNGKVIGGCRLMFSSESKILSNEIPHTQHNYQSIIEKYDQRKGLVFGEISSVVVLKGERDRSVSTKILGASLEELKKHGCNYMFGVAVAAACRDYRRIFREFGYFVEIMMSCPWQQRETYNFDKMFPMYSKIC